jgi:hypothetical protein
MHDAAVDVEEDRGERVLEDFSLGSTMTPNCAGKSRTAPSGPRRSMKCHVSDAANRGEFQEGAGRK